MWHWNGGRNDKEGAGIVTDCAQLVGLGRSSVPTLQNQKNLLLLYHKSSLISLNLNPSSFQSSPFLSPLHISILVCCSLFFLRYFFSFIHLLLSIHILFYSMHSNLNTYILIFLPFIYLIFFCYILVYLLVYFLNV